MRRLFIFSLVAVLFSTSAVMAMPPRPDQKGQAKVSGTNAVAQKPFSDYVKKHPGLNSRKAGLSRLSSYIGPKAMAKFSAAPAVTGVKRALVILIDFPDNLQGTPAYHYSEILFSSGTYASGSLRDYYKEVSYSQVDLTGDATGWYRLTQNYSYYTNNESGFGDYPRNAQKMVEDAVLKANPQVDFSRYDNDGDGYVDMLFVVHAGDGAEADNRNPAKIWSHMWATNTPINVDGVKVYFYSMEPEDGTIGVFCHELGHVFGLPDLYDYDYDSAGAGDWSIMASGGWLGQSRDGSKPAHFDAWSKTYLGWVKPEIKKSDEANVSIPQVETNKKILKLWTKGEPGNEYFLVENRQQTGFDSYLPGSGLVIWHVDEAVGNNNNQSHYKVAVEQADGLTQLERYVNIGNSGDPWPGTSVRREFTGATTPNSNSYAARATSVKVSNVSDSASNMTADIGVGVALDQKTVVEGYIRDSLSNNIANVAVSAYVGSSTMPVNSYQTSDDGLYRLYLSSGVNHVVRPVKAGWSFSPSSRAYSPLVSNQTSQNFTATAGNVYSISGYVKSGATALANITVLLQFSGVEQSALTSGSGYYQFTGLKPEYYKVLPSSAQWAFTPQSYELYLDQSMSSRNFSGAPALGTISGIIEDISGSRISGAAVTAYSWSGLSNATVVTNSNGVYYFYSVPSGTYDLLVQPPAGPNLLSGKAQAVQVTGGQMLAKNFILQAGGTITGVVKDSYGNGIQSVSVSASDWQTGTYGNAYTDSSGNYSIPRLETGDYHVDFYPGYDSTFARKYAEISVTKGQAKTLNVMLEVGGTISGRVVNSLGNPIQGATLYASDWVTGGWGWVSTDANGDFSVKGLGTGEYILNIDPPGGTDYVRKRKENISVSAGQTKAVGIIVLQNGGKISGYVRDGSGNPVSGAWVYGYDWYTGSYGSFATGADGAYLIKGLTTGTCSVYVEPPAALNLVRKQIANISVVEGQTVALNLILERGGTLKGTVIDVAGRPVTNLWVYASFADSQGGGYGWGYTGSDGSYLMNGLATGSYYVSFQPSADSELAGKQSEDISIVAGSTATLDASLAIGGRIVGGVTDRAGNPVSRAYVNAYAYFYGEETAAMSSGRRGALGKNMDPGGTAPRKAMAMALPGINLGLKASSAQGPSAPGGGRLAETLAKTYDPKRSYWGTGVTDYSGNFTIRGLNSGEFALMVQPRENSDLAQKNVQGISVSLGQTASQNVVLDTAGKISGRVKDVAGNGIAATYIYANSLDGGWGSAITDSDGNYLIKGLSAGAYFIYVSLRPGSELSAQTAVNVPVKSGETIVHDFTLVQGGKLAGRVTDAKTGAGVSNVSVSAENPLEYSWGGGRTDSNGYFFLTGLAQGTFNLYVDAYGTEYAMQRVKGINIVSGKTTEQSVTLHIGGKITGSVTDETGNLVWGGYVYAYTEFGPEGWGYAEASTGTYTLKGLPSGTYVVSAYPPASSKLAQKYMSGISVQVENTSVVNFKLPVAGAIKGTVAMQGLPTGVGYGYGVMGFEAPKTFSAGTLYSDIMDVAYGGWVKPDGEYAIPQMAPGTYDVYPYLEYYGYSQSGVAPASLSGGQPAGEPDLRKLLVQRLKAKPVSQGEAQLASGGYDQWITFLGSADGISVKSGQTESVAAITPETGTGVLSGAISTADGSVVYSGDTWPLIAMINAAGRLAAFGFVSVDSGNLTRASYKIGNLAAGTYTAVAISGGFSSQSAIVKIGAGVTTKDFILTTGSSVSGKVKNGAGSPVNGATVRISGSNTDNSAVTNSEGYYFISGLSPGKVSLTALAQGYTTISNLLTIEKNRAYSVDFSLAPAGEILGKVKVLGVAYQGAAVLAIPKDYSSVHKVLTDADGVYRIGGLGFGEYYVAALAEGYEINKAEASISITSQAVTVDFDLAKEKVNLSFGIYQISAPRGVILTVKSGSLLSSFSYKLMRENGAIIQEGKQSSTVNAYTLSVLSDTIPSNEVLTLEVSGSLKTENTIDVKETLTFQIGTVTTVRKEVDDMTGGKVLMEDSGEQKRDKTSIEFGAGSLVKISTDSLVNVSLLKSSPPADIQAKAASSVYEIGLGNADLSTSGNITLSLAYDSTKVSDTKALAIFSYNPNSGEWEALEGVELDALNSMLTVSLKGGDLSAMQVKAAPAAAGKRVVTLGAGARSSRFVVMETGSNYAGSEVKVFNFPNPFDLKPKSVPLNAAHAGSAGNPMPTNGTVIKYEVPPSVTAGHASIRIYSLAGELVRVLDQGQITGGKYYYTVWDGRNSDNQAVANGVYYGILALPGVKAKDATFKMVIVK